MKFLLVVIIFAVVMYFAIRWMQDRGPGGTPAKRQPTRKPPTRPVAPDDDESFLRDLERKRRKQARDVPPPDPPTPPAPSPET